ncbi:hypothetical protein EIP91_006509 [Steccherinum ochraceum]|uniref:Nucleolus and neural progenitor protein-like N-terminal domain-containing protein n=1 Tax=Steccherinum ochraceum TaxID=92696 RepID=A0A4R0RRB6_9APHY|nr:hypothetical protein EIP91_006509 [Steccherinum ochraceum]
MRLSKVHKFSHSPRSDLPQHSHSSVDSVLKDLKTCARRLQAAMNSQRIELRILDQLYYKGNNQHRTALFWNRIEEVRRYRKRLEQLEVYETVESLRTSFWGSQASVTQKSLKGAWTHIPDIRAVKVVLNRLGACKLLMDKMRQCLTETYAHLNLNLQTGAFLQLILTLSGIISRLASLLSEIFSLVEAAWENTRKILTILNAGPKLKDTTCVPGSSSNVVREVATLTTLQAEEVEEEDVGDRAPYASTSDVAPKNLTTRTLRPTTMHDEDDERVDAGSLSASGGITFRTTKEGTNAQPVVRRTLAGNNPAKVTESRSLSKGKSSDAPRKAGTKKKRDAIDDIFGF